MSIEIHESWKKVLSNEFEKPYFKDIKRFLIEEKKAGKVIFPKGPDIFNAYNYTPFTDVKAVILGQDPYHGVGQAHGLSFSVQHGVPIPPSLKNIYKELADDIDGFTIPNHGFLQSWAEQGVLLLNSALTVEAHQANSHQKIGWGHFTDASIKALSNQREHLVFLLWGSFAKTKIPLIDSSKHLILTAPHPSPLSAYRGFFGCQHFSKTNQYLMAHKKQPINWKL